MFDIEDYVSLPGWVPINHTSEVTPECLAEVTNNIAQAVEHGIPAVYRIDEQGFISACNIMALLITLEQYGPEMMSFLADSLLTTALNPIAKFLETKPMDEMEFTPEELRNLQYFENTIIDCMAVGHDSIKMQIGQASIMVLHMALGHKPGDPFDAETAN